MSASDNDVQAASTPADSEMQIIRAARSGDRAAFAALVRRHENAVCAVAYALTGRLSLSEDVAQETFIVVWRRLNEFKEHGHFRSWVVGIARRTSRYAIRAQRRTHLRERRLSAADEPATRDPSPLERVISKEEELFVWHALGKIPEIYRVPLVLFYRDCSSVREVAAALDMSETSVKMRLSRARRMLGQHLMQVEAALGRMLPRKEIAAGVMAVVLAEGARPASARTRRRGRGLSAPARVWLARAVLGAGLVTTLSAGVYVARGPRAPERAAGHEEVAPPASVPPRFEPGVQAPAAGPTHDEAPSLKAPRRIVQLDFEDGQVPRFASSGQTTSCPARPGNRFCFAGEIIPRGNFLEVGFQGRAAEDSPGLDGATMFTYSRGLVLGFDYWIARRANLGIQLSDVDRGTYNINLRNPSPGVWTHVEVALQSATSAQSPTTPMQDGDSIHALYISTRVQSDQTLYVDNISVSEP